MTTSAKIISISWCVLINLIEVAVVVTMLGVAHTSFEKVVISALVLIYLAVKNYFSLLGDGMMKKGQQDLARFFELAKQLKIDTEIYREAYTENQNEINDFSVGQVIDMVFRTVIFFIAMFALVTAII